MILLQSGDFRLLLDPAGGGAIAAFEWRGLPVFRPACGPSIMDQACFPLVPFSNRIAHGRFSAGGHQVQLKPNFPGSDHPHPLHGIGWLTQWQTVSTTSDATELEYHYREGEWPWPHVARQRLALADDGLTVELSVRNVGATPMPCGLGLHPYFPCNQYTRLIAFHEVEVVVDAECLPVGSNVSAVPKDWWNGAPVRSRQVDTAYLNRNGVICIQWPEIDAELLIHPSSNLRHTVIFTPATEGYFCVEPVSHATNSFNAHEAGIGAHEILEPDATYLVSCRFSMRVISKAGTAAVPL